METSEGKVVSSPFCFQATGSWVVGLGLLWCFLALGS